MKNLSFNELPQAISQLYAEVLNIKQILLDNTSVRNPDSDQWFALNELCEYLPDKPSKATIYAYVHDRVIPFHKGAKKLRFLKSEIDAWMKDGRKDSSSGPDIPPESYLKIKKVHKK